MRLSWLLSLPTMLSVVSAMAIEKRDADFLSVRTKQHKDMSGKGGDPKGKYFHESVFHPHYDGRFADKQLGYRERRIALSNLIQTYLSTFADIGVETWLMHGTLLGWWWNRKILPWDSDSDVQVSEASMHYIASYYNMSVFHYKTPRIPEGRDYMLEVNPHYINREQSDKLNVIDARWVDTTSGLFIDITTARYNYTHPAGPGMLSCKDGHEYRDSYIFPLRDTFFEGAPAKIPFAYKELLEAEYKEKALTLTEFEGHHFDETKLEWIPVPKKVEPKKEEKKAEPKKEKKPEAKKEEKKPEEKKADPPKQQTQNQQGQQKQEQKPQQSQQNNQQKQQTDQQKPSPQQDKPKADEKPQAPTGGKPQGQQSPPPPIAKQGTQPVPPKRAEPQKPDIQAKAEEKLLKKEEKKKATLKKVEGERWSADLRAMSLSEQRKIAQKHEEEKNEAKAGAEKNKEQKTNEAGRTSEKSKLEQKPVSGKPKQEQKVEVKKNQPKSEPGKTAEPPKQDSKAPSQKSKQGQKIEEEKKKAQEKAEAENNKNQKSEVRDPSGKPKQEIKV